MTRLLYYRSDVRSVAFILLAIAVYAVQWAGVLRHPALYAAGLGLAFIGCVINHNHQHHPTFVSRRLNRLFGGLISLAAGVPATAIVEMHQFNHHVHNNRPQDFVRASIVRWRWNLLNLLVFPFAALARYAPVKSAGMRAWRVSRPALYRQLVFERCVLYPTVLALLTVRPWETLLYVVGPYLFGQWAIVAINHVQHAGCDPESQYRHSRDVVGRWVNWWVFNNGYHTAHHLRPGLHWSLLPHFHEEIRPQLDPRLERRSMLLTLWEMYVWPARTPDLRASHTLKKVDWLPPPAEHPPGEGHARVPVPFFQRAPNPPYGIPAEERS